ncbi:unnamed protein product [Closterium sp. Naga37s-1]|nr:unnamed protein product [Closterium sp. Naga37s-1]
MVLSRRRRFAVNGAGLAAEGPLGIPVGVLIGFVALVACVIATGYYATSRANQEAAEAKAKLAEMEKRWAERGGLSQSQGGQAEPPPGGLGTTQAGGMSQMKMDAEAAAAASAGLATCSADLKRAKQQLRIARGWVREGLEHCVKLRKKYSKARHKWQARKGKGGASAAAAAAGAADGDSGYGDGIEDDEKDEKDDEDKEDKEDEHGLDKHGGDGDGDRDDTHVKDRKDDDEDEKDDDADHEIGVKAGVGV